MFCPKCKDEFIAGIKECPDCTVPLIEELPPKPDPVYVELVTVLENGDPGVIMVAKSILEEAGIQCYAKGEGLPNLFGLGSFGTGYNLLTGPVQIEVARDDAVEALLFLKELAE